MSKAKSVPDACQGRKGRKDENEKHENEPVSSDGHVAFSVRLGVRPNQSGRSRGKDWRCHERISPGCTDNQNHAKRLATIPAGASRKLHRSGKRRASVPGKCSSTRGWRVRLEMARKWRDAVNKHGGDVTVVHLPEVGIKGNTHFPFSDLNNLQIADLMSTWLNKKGLDKYPKRK
jgi:hypothetical protein